LTLLITQFKKKEFRGETKREYKTTRIVVVCA